MNIIQAIKEEIAIEKRIIKRYLEFCKEATTDKLICKQKNGKNQFYFRERGEKQITYIKKQDYETVKKHYIQIFAETTIEILEDNIRKLTKVIDGLRPYDADTVHEMLPAAYKKFRKEYKSHGENHKEGNDSKKGFPQSENPKDRDKLVYNTSFGLYVRSKNELLIAEALYAVGLVFWYERRLEIVVCDDGKYYTEIIFPDFTIMLPDGTLIYWEHFGMMENPKYQEDNYRRLQKYLSNGIYPPKNLIMTFDGEKMPFDNSAIWRIIEGQLLFGYDRMDS